MWRFNLIAVSTSQVGFTLQKLEVCAANIGFVKNSFQNNITLLNSRNSFKRFYPQVLVLCRIQLYLFFY